MNHTNMFSYAIKNIFLLAFITVACSQRSSKNSKTESKSEQESIYPAQIISSSASLRKETSGYSFDTAGSPLYFEESLYFTNNSFEKPGVSRTLRKDASGRIDTLAMDNGVVTTLQASGRGTIYACEMLGHRVVELDKAGKLIRVVSDKYNGKRIDGPNDLVVDQKGGLYFSDSQYIAGGEKMQETPAVYYVDKEGAITRVIDDVTFPNGLGLSPDGHTLYVANTPGVKLLAYDVNEDGTVTGKRSFASLELAEGASQGGADGMAVDRAGNVYAATTQGVGIQVFNNEGKHLENIKTPTPSNNVSFGGADNQTIYIAAQDGIYSIPAKVKGL